MQVTFDLDDVESYRKFLAIKSLPAYRIQGRTATFPDEYAYLIDGEKRNAEEIDYEAPEWMFDYQKATMPIAIRKRKYALFWQCGIGKTGVLLEFARVAINQLRRENKGVLIVSPLNVIEQTLGERDKFFHDKGIELPIDWVRPANLDEWLSKCGGCIGITNYEAMRPGLHRGCLGGLILDESSVLKSAYGKWGQVILRLGKGIEWKLCCTGTPAPNDRIEYANHAVLLDHYPTVNSFLATFFVNRGQTDNRWDLKPHALRPFYRALSHWCMFLSDPRVYGWHDNAESIPPIHVHIHDVPMTPEQTRIMRRITGELFASNFGGITKRSSLGQLGKGFFRGKHVPTNKPAFMRDLIDGWRSDESTIVWCLYNQEQALLEKTFPDAASIKGDTPYEKRIELIRAFKFGQIREMLSKPKILGFGLNLQVASRQVFSGLADSYEAYIQAVKRSNRYGSTRPLNVHIPVTDVEEPMVQNVLRKAHLVQLDMEEQERIFKEMSGVSVSSL